MSSDPKVVTERAIGVGALVIAVIAPVLFNAYWLDVILTQALIVGIAAASLIFLAAYGGMISLAQTMLMGSAGFMIGNMVTTRAGGESKGLTLGWDPTLALFLALAGTTLLGLLFGALAARSTGIYFLMITLTLSVVGFYFVGQVTVVSGFSGIAGINQYTPPFVGDIVNNRDKLYYIALGVAIVVYAAIRLLIRTPFGLALQGLRDEPVRMSSLGFAVPHAPDARVRLRLVPGSAGRRPPRLVAGADRAGRHRAPVDDRSPDRGRDRRPHPHRGSVGRSPRVHRHQQLHP